MCIQVPIYAAQRSGPGHWLIRALDPDPFMPAVLSVAVLVEPDYSVLEEQRGAHVIRLSPDTSKTRGDYNDRGGWRSDLLQIARLLDQLAPDIHDPEKFHIQKNALRPNCVRR
jgi:hypothetical protein